jgi:ribosomal subunit interface protein
MQIQIRWTEVESSEALTAHVEKEVTHALRHCADQFTRVDVHVHDDNADKSGSDDKRCKIEARPRGAEPLIVEGTGDDVYKTISSVSKKLERAARHFVDKRRKH